LQNEAEFADENSDFSHKKYSYFPTVQWCNGHFSNTAQKYKNCVRHDIFTNTQSKQTLSIASLIATSLHRYIYTFICIRLHTNFCISAVVTPGGHTFGGIKNRPVSVRGTVSLIPVMNIIQDRNNTKQRSCLKKSFLWPGFT
jgi:hypothetical protein